jgi:diguanylate cyclase (GGDEF)-like protein
MTAQGDDLPEGVPPDVAARIVRALDRSPDTVVTLVNADLSIAWLSHSANWVTGTDPSGRKGASSLERIHPDDVERLVHGLAQLQAAEPQGAPTVPVVETLRYRFQRFDGRWVVMEATIHNLLDDPVVNGLLVEARPVDGGLDGVGHVVDLLVAEAPLAEVLGACARLVPVYLGSAAVVAVTDEGTVLGTAPGSPADRLAQDERWWRDALKGELVEPVRLDDLPEDMAAAARAEGFVATWTVSITAASSTEVIGCVVVWVRIGTELNITNDTALRQTKRLAELAISEQRHHDELVRRAGTDPLTGLANRSVLRRRLDSAPGAVTMAILDLDDFKPVNDNHGHHAGDAVLQAVAGRLHDVVREDDLVVRFGGDEFAVVFADGTSPESATHLAERIRRAVGAPIALEGGAMVRIHASVGLATAPADDVVRLADIDLYATKRRRSTPPPS